MGEVVLPFWFLVLPIQVQAFESLIPWVIDYRRIISSLHAKIRNSLPLPYDAIQHGEESFHTAFRSS